MLPALIRTQQPSLSRASQPKAYEPPVSFQQQQDRKRTPVSFTLSAKKIKSGSALRKNDPIENITSNQKEAAMNRPIYLSQKGNQSELSSEIKAIERKIRLCQKKIDMEKKRNQLLANTGDNSSEYDFEKVIQRQMELQKANRPQFANQNNFDYLTNPGKVPQEQQLPQESAEQKLEPKHYNIQEGLQRMERHYENSLKRKFERRQMFPHQPCRRKTPKLSITEKNAMMKQGRPFSDQEHLFRVMTRETTPQQIYPTIPNFAVVKDNLSKNIVAYLGDYKPFVDKTKQGRGVDQDKIDQKMAKSSSNKLIVNEASAEMAPGSI